MHTNIDGQDVPVGIAYGYGHQVERQYDAVGDKSMKWPAGQCSLDLPWFRDIRDAISFLKLCPFPGRIQTWVLEPDGSKPSWITAGQYYTKPEGAMRDALEQRVWIKQHVVPELENGSLKAASPWWFKIKDQGHPEAETILEDEESCGPSPR
jgi:hypothetical protein